jgi:hypothetical protein
MRPAAIVGVILIVLGIASLFVGIPSREKHGIKVGDADIGVETKTTKAVPIAISALLIVGGVVAVAAGSRKG